MTRIYKATEEGILFIDGVESREDLVKLAIIAHAESVDDDDTYYFTVTDTGGVEQFNISKTVEVDLIEIPKVNATQF